MKLLDLTTCEEYKLCDDSKACAQHLAKCESCKSLRKAVLAFVTFELSEKEK